jgi:hypothetical protein
VTANCAALWHAPRSCYSASGASPMYAARHHHMAWNRTAAEVAKVAEPVPRVPLVSVPANNAASIAVMQAALQAIVMT